ncbi:MAG: hypothetical protein ACRBN8_37575 [Nannocystales bacterium]
MKPRRTKSLLSLALSSLLVPAAALAAVASVSTSAHAAPAKKPASPKAKPKASTNAEKAVCKVHAVLASKEGDGKIPKNLEFMKEWLTDEPYDRYKSFHLLGSKKVELKVSKATAAEFKTGHKMKLSLLGGDEKKLKLHLDLTHRDGKKNLVAMDYSIEDNGLFFVQGGEHKSGEVTGRIFWAIQCARR